MPIVLSMDQTLSKELDLRNPPVSKGAVLQGHNKYARSLWEDVDVTRLGIPLILMKPGL